MWTAPELMGFSVGKTGCKKAQETVFYGREKNQGSGTLVP
jgi:hypothetical protein